VKPGGKAAPGGPSLEKGDRFFGDAFCASIEFRQPAAAWNLKLEI
jgi:hypothetical protein